MQTVGRHEGVSAVRIPDVILERLRVTNARARYQSPRSVAQYDGKRRRFGR